MASEEQMVAAAQRYARCFSVRAREGWPNNFTEEPELIEPAYSSSRKNRDHFSRVFDAIGAFGLKIELTPVRIIVNGNEAAAYLTVRTNDARLPKKRQLSKIAQSSMMEESLV